MHEVEVSTLGFSEARVTWEMYVASSDSRERRGLIDKLERLAFNNEVFPPQTQDVRKPGFDDVMQYIWKLITEPMYYPDDIDGLYIRHLVSRLWDYYGFYGDKGFLEKIILGKNLPARAVAARLASSVTCYEAIPWLQHAIQDSRYVVATIVDDNSDRRRMMNALHVLLGAKLKKVRKDTNLVGDSQRAYELRKTFRHHAGLYLS